MEPAGDDPVGATPSPLFPEGSVQVRAEVVDGEKLFALPEHGNRLVMARLFWWDDECVPVLDVVDVSDV